MANGLMPFASASGAVDVRLPAATRAHGTGRGSSYIALNFQPVSTWSNGKGAAAGWKALRARCSITELSLPAE